MTPNGIKVAFVVAMDLKRTIGKGKDLPWRLPEDMRRFRKITLGQTIVMGRSTYDSIGRPLIGRRNIVLSTQKNPPAGGFDLARSVQDVFDMTAGYETIYIIGGAQIYALFEPYVDTVYATIVETTIPDGDTFFPTLKLAIDKQINGHHRSDENNNFPMRFETWTRRYATDEDRVGGAPLGTASAV